MQSKVHGQSAGEGQAWPLLPEAAHCSNWSAQKACRLLCQGLMPQIVPRSGRQVATLAIGSQTAIGFMATLQSTASMAAVVALVSEACTRPITVYIYICKDFSNIF